jgi:apolipoprotein D and lipocalin family protein
MMMKNNSILKKFLFGLLVFIPGCTGLPDNVTVIKNFDVNRYLGTWYEIARFDHSFEKGLEKVTANYSLRNDGGIKVVNKGFDSEKNKWKDAEGKAYFLDNPNIGRLKVSFFGPFYASYNIIALDENNYSYSMVCGPNKSYLWILSRTPQLNDSIKSSLLNKAKALGFDIGKLIFVKQ